MDLHRSVPSYSRHIVSRSDVSLSETKETVPRVRKALRGSRRLWGEAQSRSLVEGWGKGAGTQADIPALEAGTQNLPYATAPPPAQSVPLGSECPKTLRPPPLRKISCGTPGLTEMAV